MIDIHFAPIQGYTDSVYRKAHCELAGGVSMYYTPFIRLVPSNQQAKTYS